MMKENTPRRAPLCAAMLPGCAKWARVIRPTGGSSAAASLAGTARDVACGEVAPSSAALAIRTAHPEKSSGL